jgi:hypothetical protein
MFEVQRSSPRVYNVVEVDCRTLDAARATVVARMSDLSATGAFLDSMGGLRPGTLLALGFKVGDQDVRVTAEVVHQMPQFGMGVRFIEMTPEGREAIEALVRARS